MKKRNLPVSMAIALGLIVLISGCDLFNGKKTNPKISTVAPNVIHISSNKMFTDSVLNNNKPAIVKFETKWCGACKVMAPIYEKLASKYLKKINFTVIEVDKFSELADKYQIQGVPTFIFFRDGKNINQIIGAVSEKEFEEAVKQLL